MNYRHHFHAGNFADLIKHVALLATLQRLAAAGAALTVIDTHGGAGLYDLTGEMPSKSGEAQSGVVRLMAEAHPPAAFDALKAALGLANPDGRLRYYPGSPLLAAQALGPKDRLVACELRPEDAATLKATLGSARPRAKVEVVCADGYATAPAILGAGERGLVLIDPPFERPDDYERSAACLAAIHRRAPSACVIIWTPLKDLETFDRLLRALEVRDAPPILVAETRLRPLRDPMKMNGCALVIANPVAGLEAVLEEACAWIVAALGQPGGEARVWRL